MDSKEALDEAPLAGKSQASLYPIQEFQQQSNAGTSGKAGDIYLSGYDDDDSYEGVYSSIELATGNGIIKAAPDTKRLTGLNGEEPAENK